MNLRGIRINRSQLKSVVEARDPTLFSLLPPIMNSFNLVYCQWGFRGVEVVVVTRAMLVVFLLLVVSWI